MRRPCGKSLHWGINCSTRFIPYPNSENSSYDAQRSGNGYPPDYKGGCKFGDIEKLADHPDEPQKTWICVHNGNYHPCMKFRYISSLID